MAKERNDGNYLWVVLDSTGHAVYCASWQEACHEHINDAINEFGLAEASEWVVRKAVIIGERKS